MFFTTLAEFMDQNSDLHITFKKKDNQLTVGVFFTGAKEITPLTISGTAQELDAEFFSVLAEPIQKVNSFVFNAEQVKKSVEDAKAKASEKSKKSSATPSKLEPKKQEPKAVDLFAIEETKEEVKEEVKEEENDFDNLIPLI